MVLGSSYGYEMIILHFLMPLSGDGIYAVLKFSVFVFYCDLFNNCLMHTSDIYTYRVIFEMTGFTFHFLNGQII